MVNRLCRYCFSDISSFWLMLEGIKLSNVNWTCSYLYILISFVWFLKSPWIWFWQMDKNYGFLSVIEYFSSIILYFYYCVSFRMCWCFIIVFLLLTYCLSQSIFCTAHIGKTRTLRLLYKLFKPSKQCKVICTFLNTFVAFELLNHWHGTGSVLHHRQWATSLFDLDFH